jgi:hypothetical protein
MPVTLEFLSSFAATLALVFILAAALAAQHDEITESMKSRREISKAALAAREVESWLNNGRISGLDFTDENLSVRIEKRLIVAYNGKFIEVEGVFVNDRAEPV